MAKKKLSANTLKIRAALNKYNYRAPSWGERNDTLGADKIGNASNYPGYWVRKFQANPSIRN